jgi:AcrR family transcriptional regulator
MPTRREGVHLGDADLGGQRHVCGLFDGPDDAANALVPFILEGLERGERVVHVVEERQAYLGRLADRTDISAALESGQLDIRSWAESYVSGGAFGAARMLAYMRRSLRQARWLGFPGTRLIGDMEWAQDGVPGVDELLAYEREVDAIATRPRTSVVCAYDLRRHSAGRIANIVDAHQATLVGGRLRPSQGAGRPPRARERILTAASMLFAENGPGQTGVDSLIEAAGVAKATFYRHFPSKDALIIAWLQDPRTRWFDRVRAQAEARATSPAEVIPRLFEAVADWLEADDYLGCPYLNTSIEISDPAHPATQAIQDYLAEIGRYLEDHVAAAGQPDAAGVSRELHAMMAGAISLGAVERTGAYALAARDAATRLLGGQQPSRRLERAVSRSAGS